MRNVEAVPPRLGYRIRMKGAPPPIGWFVMYVSGMEEVEDVKPSYWLTQWDPSSESITFRFEPERTMHFENEADATEASRILRELAAIETEVVKVGI
jgi:hypothetical protein